MEEKEAEETEENDKEEESSPWADLAFYWPVRAETFTKEYFTV